MSSKACQVPPEVCNSSCRNYSGCTPRKSMLEDLLLEQQGKPLTPAFDFRIDPFEAQPQPVYH